MYTGTHEGQTCKTPEQRACDQLRAGTHEGRQSRAGTPGVYQSYSNKGICLQWCIYRLQIQLVNTNDNICYVRNTGIKKELQNKKNQIVTYNIRVTYEKSFLMIGVWRTFDSFSLWTGILLLKEFKKFRISLGGRFITTCALVNTIILVDFQFTPPSYIIL